MRTATLVLFVLSVTSSALAGTYTFVVDRNPISPAKPNFMNEYAIVHPIGYDGSGGALQIGVCVESGDEDLIPSVERAIRIWNELIPATGNCENCGIWEDPNPVMGPIDTAATILHEFGHCGLGLDHINAVEHTGFPTFWSVGTCDLDSDGNCGSSTSFTPFINPTEIMNTPGTPRGDAEDLPVNQCPTAGPVASEGPASSLACAQTAEGLEREELRHLLGMSCPAPPQCCPQCPGPDCHSDPWCSAAARSRRLQVLTALGYSDAPAEAERTASGRPTSSRCQRYSM